MSHGTHTNESWHTCEWVMSPVVRMQRMPTGSVFGKKPMGSSEDRECAIMSMPSRMRKSLIPVALAASNHCKRELYCVWERETADCCVVYNHEWLWCVVNHEWLWCVVDSVSTRVSWYMWVCVRERERSSCCVLYNHKWLWCVIHHVSVRAIWNVCVYVGVHVCFQELPAKFNLCLHSFRLCDYPKGVWKSVCLLNEYINILIYIYIYICTYTNIYKN